MVLGPQKSFWGPPKHKKINILKKPEFGDLTEHWGLLEALVNWVPSDPLTQ